MDQGIRQSMAGLRVFCEAGQGRVGIGVSKKAGCHPIRNQVKRRVRQILQLRPHLLQAELDYVFILGTSAATTSFAELATQIDELFVKINDRWANRSPSS